MASASGKEEDENQTRKNAARGRLAFFANLSSIKGRTGQKQEKRAENEECS
jgi:hypothetical protein